MKPAVQRDLETTSDNAVGRPVSDQPPQSFVSRSLDTVAGSADWKLQWLAGPAPDVVRDRLINASTPGCVHTDLMAEGLIDDPYLGLNETKVTWIGRCDWRYELAFNADPNLLHREHLELVCDGLDTLATVTLNGREIGRADNMHGAWRFDVKGVLSEGENRLRIDFAAPVPFIEAEHERVESAVGRLPVAGSGSNPQLPQHMIRKMHCNFGWDWGPALITSGIWRSVRLEGWDQSRITAVRPNVQSVSVEQATVAVAIDRTGSGVVRYEFRSPDGATLDAGETEASDLRFVVDAPQLWWPAGLGEQPLYTLRLTSAAGQTVERRIGLRRFEWHTHMDAAAKTVAGQQQQAGNTFHLTCNGRYVFCVGANWIPDDCFPHRVTPQRYRQRVQQARDANMNMLRVWGGGIYEDDAFYDACDELGVMVWQDFATGCSSYPETPEFIARFEKEARDNVARLAGRASLALWCGGNENIVATFGWGERFMSLRDASYGWGKHYWYDLFPRIAGELDPGTWYWPNSPWSGTDDIHADAEHVGDQHIWDVWNGQGDWRNYWSHVPRFASEFGFHGPPTWPTLAAAIPAKARHWFSDAMVHHNKQDDGQQRAVDRAGDHFHLPNDPASPEGFEDMWFIAGVNQARALQAGCGWFRALSPWCGGALFWQHNDCWPVSSWSCIDQNSAGEGRAKLLWYAARRFFAPRFLQVLPTTVTAKGDEPRKPGVFLRNDAADVWAGTMTLRLMSFAGERLAEHREAFKFQPTDSTHFDVPDDWENAPDTLLVAEAEGAPRATWFFARDKALRYPKPKLDLATDPLADGQQIVRVTAGTLVRDLCLLADRAHPPATVDDQLHTLLPGETATFVVRTDQAIGVDDLRDPRVLRCVNPFGRS